VAGLLLALLTGSVGLLGDAIRNLSDVSTSAEVFIGFRVSIRPASERYPITCCRRLARMTAQAVAYGYGPAAISSLCLLQRIYRTFS
jgi:Co/Zn/Cd efflux system component